MNYELFPPSRSSHVPRSLLAFLFDRPINNFVYCQFFIFVCFVVCLIQSAYQQIHLHVPPSLISKSELVGQVTLFVCFFVFIILYYLYSLFVCQFLCLFVCFLFDSTSMSLRLWSARASLSARSHSAPRLSFTSTRRCSRRLQ